MNNDVMVLETNLAVKFTDKAIADLKEQKQQLVKFVQTHLKRDVDYGIIPGVKNPSLFKPGAEKLANLFQLGSRIIKTDKTIDIEKNFAMIGHTIEVFHIPTGKAIAQCEGITNSQEKKWRERKDYNTGKAEPTPIGDVLNTLGKMALKRAYVGAVIMAVGASDFFTQDVEDMPEFQQKTPIYVDQPTNEETDQARDLMGYHIPFGKFKSKTLEQVGVIKLKNYVNYLETSAQEQGKPIQGQVLDFIERACEFIASFENGPDLDQGYRDHR